MTGGGEDVSAWRVLSNHGFESDGDGRKGFREESEGGRVLVAITGVAMSECTDVDKKKTCAQRKIEEWYRQAAKGEARNLRKVSGFSVRVVNNELKSP
jgi:hypothetical protein